MIDEAEIKTRLSGPGMFTCERWLCRMPIKDCLKRQDKRFDGYVKHPKFRGEMAFPHCQQCPQGMENRQQAALRPGRQPRQGDPHPNVVRPVFGREERPVDRPSPVKGRRAVSRVAGVNAFRNPRPAGQNVQLRGKVSSMSRYEEVTAGP